MSAQIIETGGSISERLRQVIADSGETHYALAKQAGIRPQMLDYFMAGERSLRLETLDKLAPVLGLRLQAQKRTARSGSR